MNAVLKILLVDDHALVRQGLRQALEAAAYEVIAEAESGDGGYHEYLEHRPDLVIMDLSMAAGSGIEAIHRIHAAVPEANILVVTMHDEPAIARRAINAGALGYVTKTSSAQVFLQAVRKVSKGLRFLSHDIALALALSSPDGASDPLASLSDREIEVLQMLVGGLRVAEISSTLNLSPKSVTNIHLRIKRKLNTRSFADLVRFAIQTGISKQNILSQD